MAKEDTDAPAEEGGKKKGGLVPLLLVGLIGAAVGGGGSYFYFASQAKAAATEAQMMEEGADGQVAETAGGAAAAEEADASETLIERQIELMPFVVNITDEGLTRYLKVQLELEVRDAEDRDPVLAYKSRIRDAIIVLLSTKRMADLNQFEGKLLLKDEMRDRINALFGDALVRSVLLTEFVVQ